MLVTLSLHFTGLGGGIGLGSVGLNPENQGSGRVRACTEAVLVNHLQRHLVADLEKQQLLATFTEIEMPTLILLANMELNGFGNYITFCLLFFFIFGVHQSFLLGH